MSASDSAGPPAQAETKFLLALTAIAVAALIFRLVYVLAMEHHLISPDGFGYHLTARGVADGLGFINPLSGRPSANHPPLWTLVLALLRLVGRNSVLSAQILGCFMGTATVAAVGFAGRRVSSTCVGLIAAAIAAGYAGLWVYEQRLLSETLLFLGVATLVILSYRYREGPSPWRAGALGAVCGLLALTRSEQILLVPALVVPLILGWRWRGINRTRVISLVFACLAAAVVMSPWIVYNLGRFDQPVVLSDSLGSAMAQGNCDSVYFGRRLGYFDLNCLAANAAAAGRRGFRDPLADAPLRREALTYMSDHADRLPIVSLARQGRVWSLFKPFETLETQAQFPQDPWWPQGAALISYWVLLPAAVMGGVVLRRQRVSLIPLVAPFVITVITVASTYGEPRLRAGVEVPLVLLAAVGIAKLATTTQRRRSARTEPRIDDDSTAPLTARSSAPEPANFAGNPTLHERPH